MASCVTISRFVLVLLNLLLFLIGALLLVVGILTIYVPDQVISNNILERSADLMVVLNASYIEIAAWVCVGLGVVIVIVAMCGCMGSACSSRVLLGIYIFVVIQIIIVQVGVAVVIYLSPDWFTSSAQDTLNDYVAQYPADPFAESVLPETIAWNVFQYAIECCGIDGPADYKNLTGTNGPKYYSSCCKVEDPSKAALAAADESTDMATYNYTNLGVCKRYFGEVVQVDDGMMNDPENLAEHVNLNGCIDMLTNNLRAYAIAAIAVVAIQIFIVIIACIVCCAAGEDEKPI